jgi:hypothetical protein
VKDAAGIAEDHSPDDARTRIARLLPPGADPLPVVEPITSVLGFGDSVAGPDEIFFAVRRLIEALAHEQPLVIVFDDIQWGEPTFLDLVEYVGGFTRGVPVLMLSLARGELLETRPRWGESIKGARSLLLQPLDTEGIRELIQNLLRGGLAEQVEVQVTDAAQGNPLFVEEMLRMLVEDRLLERQNGGWTAASGLSRLVAPPSIQALLAARLERLEPEERAVIERAAVIGKEFSPSAIAALSPEALRPEISNQLQALVRKDLIKPGGPPFAGEDSYAFGHLLTRDAAYQEILKETRAQLHERFADWLEARSTALIGEYEEIVAYHLEQAYLNLEALGRSLADERGLAPRAARHLASAGRRALGRGDMPAAVKLLERSLALDGHDASERLTLMLELAHAVYVVGELDRAHDLLNDVEREALAIDDTRLALRARIERDYVLIWKAPKASLEELRGAAEEAIRAFGEMGDDIGLAKAHRNLATYYFFACQWGRAGDLLERAVLHARKGRDHVVAEEMLPGVATALCMGPVPVAEALRRLEALLERGSRQKSGPRLPTVGTRASVEARGIATLKAMSGRFDEAREICRRAKHMLSELGQAHRLADLGEAYAWIEMLAGHPAEAERELRSSYEILERTGDTAVLSTVIAELAEVALEQGRDGEAEALAERSWNLAAHEDVESQVSSRMTRARVLSRRGEFERGEELAREAVASADRTESPNLQGGALLALAEVLDRAERTGEAADVAARAVAVYESKGNVAAAARATSALERLGDPG